MQPDDQINKNAEPYAHMLLTNVIQTRGMLGIWHVCSIVQARKYRELLDCVECEREEVNNSSQDLRISRLSPHIPLGEPIIT